jgi:hypothetical protein
LQPQVVICLRMLPAGFLKLCNPLVLFLIQVPYCEGIAYVFPQHGFHRTRSSPRRPLVFLAQSSVGNHLLHVLQGGEINVGQLRPRSMNRDFDSASFHKLATFALQRVLWRSVRIATRPENLQNNLRALGPEEEALDLANAASSKE